MTRRTAPLSVALGLICAVVLAAPPQLGGPLPGPFPLFPADNWWNADISGAPVDPSSAALISFIGGDVLHPDFGGTRCPGCDAIYGFPYIVVDAAQPKRNVTFTSYASESDHVGYPIPDEAITQPHWIEHGEPGNQNVPGVDRHMLIVDKDNKHLYELYQVFWDGSKWTAAAGAFFDMKTNNRRPEGWTSTDAAGLAVLPGLVRYDEVYGPDEIGHAFRFTVRLSNGYVYPASHAAGSTSGALPMGARLRLKASKNISNLPPEMQKIARAMKKHGLIVADNGADMFISGTFDPRWNNDILNPAFAALTANDFEVVKRGWVPGPFIQLTTPNGGDQWPAGSSRQISWTSANLASGATVEIALTNGSSTTPVASVPASQGSYAWTVSNTPGGSWRIRLEARAGGTVQATDESDLPFTILATVSVSDITITEGNAGTANAAFPVTLSAAAPTTVTVKYLTDNGTALAGADFVTTSGTLTFAPGETAKNVTVGIVGDTLNEPTEVFYLKLHSPAGAAVARAEATGTILDNDTASATLSINDVSVTEGNSGTTNAVLTVTLSNAGGQGASVNYSTANGTAAAGSDYAAVSGNLIFAAGQTSKTITIPVNGDTEVEPNETFFVNLSSPSGATLADGQGQVTIVNDDTAPLPTLSIGDVAVAEGNSATVNARFTVTLSGTSSSAITVAYATANGTATAGTDYVAKSGTLTFPAGTTQQFVDVTVNGDTTVEPNETFFVNLSNPAGATIADGQGQGTIVNDDAAPPPLPALSINDVTVAEGNSGTTTARFTATLSAASGSAVTVAYATANGTATAGSDYVAKSGTLTFAAGTTQQTIDVTVNGDTVVEPDETFFVNLSSPSGATIADSQGKATITNDDTAPASGIPGDFNGDGQGDLLWHHQQSGDLYAWFMNGISAGSASYLTPSRFADVKWQIRGLADFNGDGRTDVLWHHQKTGELYVWMLNGTVTTAGSYLNPKSFSDTNWQIRATVDFNKDGKPDILWHHQKTGDLYVWFMNGTRVTSGSYLNPSRFADTKWQIRGTFDPNKDGEPDILWHHQGTGDLYLWFLKGTTAVSGIYLTPSRFTDTRWQIVRMSDFNKDGNTDLLWHHLASGQLYVWYMSGTTATGGAYLNPPAFTDVQWKVMPR